MSIIIEGEEFFKSVDGSYMLVGVFIVNLVVYFLYEDIFVV